MDCQYKSLAPFRKYPTKKFAINPSLALRKKDKSKPCQIKYQRTTRGDWKVSSLTMKAAVHFDEYRLAWLAINLKAAFKISVSGGHLYFNCRRKYEAKKKLKPTASPRLHIKIRFHTPQFETDAKIQDWALMVIVENKETIRTYALILCHLYEVLERGLSLWVRSFFLRASMTPVLAHGFRL